MNLNLTLTPSSINNELRLKKGKQRKTQYKFST